MEYVLVVPAQEYSDSIIKEQPFDYTSLFISKCGNNHFYINTSTTGKSIFQTNYNIPE